jgi:UDP-N-acetylglucosamine 2-epimerase
MANPSIVSIVGARPQFVKAAVVSHALAEAGLSERLVHTGQHYDAAMSDVFFDELDIPAPAVNLDVGSGRHGAQTGAMMERLEAWLIGEAEAGRPASGLLVYGDTNSTLAGALVASKLGLPVAHVEAGLRSFDRRMPEEVNRVVTDALSDLLFAPDIASRVHLAAEGILEGVHVVGDVMYDATLRFSDRAEQRRPLASLTHHAPGTYVLATVHRASNTDDPAVLQAILDGLGVVGPVVLPAHPRTRARIDAGLRVPPSVELLEPQPYLPMLTLIRNAHRVATDSGGVQREAFWLGTPCVTLRANTEWAGTLAGGWNRLIDPSLPGAPRRIAEALAAQPTGERGELPEAGAPERIASILAEAWP